MGTGDWGMKSGRKYADLPKQNRLNFLAKIRFLQNRLLTKRSRQVTVPKYA
jgi:hypothetical protein